MAIDNDIKNKPLPSIPNNEINARQPRIMLLVVRIGLFAQRAELNVDIPIAEVQAPRIPRLQVIDVYANPDFHP